MLIGYTDLFSLEPVDKLLRPLRLKIKVREYANHLKNMKKTKLNFNIARSHYLT